MSGCDWHQVDSYTWRTGCGINRIFEDKQFPSDEGMFYCCYCGGGLVEYPLTQEPQKANEFKTPAPQIHIRALVRDKEGRPKFDNPELIKDFMHRLTPEDIDYLKEQYDGKYFCN